ncbi:hypothetical protein V5O48_015638, partial [Marasmius crinis-equi]
TIFQLAERYSATLTSLSIESVALVDMTIVRLLRLTPNLTELTLTGHLSNYFFQSLGSDATLVPRLRHLNLSLVKLSHFLHAMGALPAQRASRGCPPPNFPIRILERG